MTRPTAPGARVILCGRCNGVIGHVTATTFQLRERGRWITWVSVTPAEAEVRVWCQGCQAFGALDVPTVLRRAKTYANRSGAWKASRRCLARRQDAAAGAHIETSLLDLELIQERPWKRAMAGDLTASRVVLRAIEDRVRLVEFLSGPDTQGRKQAELAKAVHEDDAARAQTRRERRKAETGYFTSLVV